MKNKMKDKTIIGLTEEIIMKGPTKKRKMIARIDSGATISSVDARLAAELGLGPVVQTKLVKSAHGNKLRPVVEARINIAGKNLKAKFTIADRDHMKYKALIGQNILKKGFLIDPNK